MNKKCKISLTNYRHTVFLDYIQGYIIVVSTNINLNGVQLNTLYKFTSHLWVVVY